MELRPYQREAVNKMLWSLSIQGNSVVVLPTGAGKTYLIAGFVEERQKPILILVPSKELLEQDLEKLIEVVDEREVGVFSASMNEKTVKKYTLGTIQSVYKHPDKFNHYETVIIDECHLVNPKNKGGMYNRFFEAIGNPKVIGLTATPYRLDSFYRHPKGKAGWKSYQGTRWQKMNLETVTTTKMITRYKNRFWHQMLYVINTHELQPEYLAELEYVDMSFFQHQEIPTNKSRSDFDLKGYLSLISDKEKEIVKKIASLQHQHQSTLVFCSSVGQAERMSSAIIGSGVVHGETPKKEREKLISGFKDASIPIIFNVGVLTTGFNHPSLDAVVMVRPTRSLNLYNQMLGRATRKTEGKDKATIYDFAGNVQSMGRLETIRVGKFGGNWNVVSSARPQGFHKAELYAYQIERKNE